jgi:hypothetical protein
VKPPSLAIPERDRIPFGWVKMTSYQRAALVAFERMCGDAPFFIDFSGGAPIGIRKRWPGVPAMKISATLPSGT